MPKKSVIKERSGKVGAEKSAKGIRDTGKKFHRTPTVVESTLSIENIKAVPEDIELFHLIDHIIQGYSHDESPIVKFEKKPNSVIYHFSKKKIAVSAARQVQRAYKHLHPEMIVENPHNHQFERVVLIFGR